ncbi:aminotransferase class V-fold PLP-dependent enzyme [Microbacterium oryzae]|uniref:aminotransferase class V-fold PLP-dependent enzyme n=1 Tax=Microbacterium oryzae TaxID=743009 RepID=UPI0025B0A0F9|nr:aminotransferase class V-fold PLP-dependent enzyme [Microbacterium oryzae]MDN3310989.1 aminotransferase class V-fold PLP-dependent enzyme [Microbacterium oryzae]
MTERYLNFASFGPPTQPVLAAAHRVDERAAAGVPAAELHREDERAIAAVSRVTGFAADGIALMPNTSTGLLHTAFAVPSGRVLVSRAEFPANLYPWWRAAEAGRLEVEVVEPAAPERPMSPDDVAGALTADTVAVAVSAVSFQTGYRVDLGALREVIGDRLLVVDAIQAMGVVQQDWRTADVIAVGGQKWLRAGWGTGFLALSPRALSRLEPLLTGWVGVENAGVYSGDEHRRRADARGFTVTNGAPSAAAALTAALEGIEDEGVAEVALRVSARASRLTERLASHGVSVVSPASAAERAGIVVARFSDAPRLHAELALAGVQTTLIGDDRIRFSPHTTTPFEVLDEVAALLGR